MIEHLFNNFNNPEFGSSMDDDTILGTAFGDLDTSTVLTNCIVGCIKELANGCRYP